MTDQVIDLTDSFTLADHGALSNVIIELDDSIYEPNGSQVSHQTTVRYEVDAPVEVSELSIPSATCSTLHRKKSKNAKKKVEPCQQRLEAKEEQIRERSPIGHQIGDCPICLDRLGTNPLASTKCGHVFCQHCLIQALRREKKCPTCRQALRGNNAYHQLFLNKV